MKDLLVYSEITVQIPKGLTEEEFRKVLAQIDEEEWKALATNEAIVYIP